MTYCLFFYAEQWHELPNFPNPNKWGYSMVSLNNDVYVTGMIIHMQTSKEFFFFPVLFERAPFSGILQTSPSAPDRWLARFKYQHLVNYRNLEVHHKRGAMGYGGSHAATQDQSHICNAQWGNLCYRR